MSTMQMFDSQFVTLPRRKCSHCEYFVRIFAWVVRAVVVVLLFSVGVQAGYKPADISDIKEEERRILIQAAREISDFPKPVRDAFLCEQLGLCFKKDASAAMYCDNGSTRFRTFSGSWYVTGNGKIAPWWRWWKKAGRMTEDKWFHAFNRWALFPGDRLLGFYSKDVERLALNTAKYLLRNMPKEHRRMVLASMGGMLYYGGKQVRHNNDNVDREQRRETWKIDNVVPVEIISREGRGYSFLDPEGKEREINALVGNLVYRSVIVTRSRYSIAQSHIISGEAGTGYWRWRWIVWRCENLIGAKDILALFPEEVEAMRKHYKERAARLKDDAKAKNDALLVAADEMMSSLPKETKLARIALAVGLYYLDHRDSGCTDGHLNPETIIILPDGTEHSGEELNGEAPGLLQQVPHEAILGFYRQPIEQMAREVAKARFREMPPVLRDLLRARLSRKLIKLDGSPAEIKEGISTIRTFDRTWRVPMDAVDHQKTYFKNSKSQSIPYSIVETYEQEYAQTLRLVNLCARILGKGETVKLIPPGSDADLTAEQQRAWLAEKMGFCFTEDGTPAYQSERTANENAVYVDAQGKVRRLSDVPGKDSAKWTETTKTALETGYDRFAASYKKEIRELAVQTSKYILTSMPPGLRQSRLAERNKFFFLPNASPTYRRDTVTSESGIVYSGPASSDYGKCLYYDPSGKIVQTTEAPEVWLKRWMLLSFCESVVGIDAINESFHDEVEAMRAAFQKSPFYKK